LGIKEMAEEIRKNAEAEAQKIRKEAREKGEGARSEASGKTKLLLEHAKAEAGAAAANEKNEKIAAAYLEAKRIVSRAKESAIGAVMEDVLKATAHARDKDYKALLKRLITEGMHEVGKDAVVRVNKEDHKLAHSLGFKVSAEPIECIGGAIIASPDGKVIFNNTFEAKFELGRERARTAAHKLLFGKGAK
jgi:V/A-type H+-transporting ATPase subunit E